MGSGDVFLWLDVFSSLSVMVWGVLLRLEGCWGGGFLWRGSKFLLKGSEGQGGML